MTCDLKINCVIYQVLDYFLSIDYRSMHKSRHSFNSENKGMKLSLLQKRERLTDQLCHQLILICHLLHRHTAYPNMAFL